MKSFSRLVRIASLALAWIIIFQACGDLFNDRKDAEGWDLFILDDQGKTGLFTSLQLDSLGKVHIAYFSDEDQSLYYYHQDQVKQITTMDSEEKPLETYGSYLSMVLDENDIPYISFHDFDYTFEEELNSLIDIVDPAEQQKLFQEIITNFFLTNTLKIYNGANQTTTQLALYGGLYTSLQLDGDGNALIAYCSYLPIDKIKEDEPFPSTDGTGGTNSSTDLLSMQGSISPPLYPTFVAFNLATSTPLADPKTIEYLPGKDMGLSMTLRAITSDYLISSYVNTTDFTIHLAQSMDKGVTWSAAPISLPHRVGDYLGMDYRVLSDGATRLAIAYTNLTTVSLFFIYSDDFGSTWSLPIAIDRLKDQNTGLYPNVLLLEDGTALFSYFFASPPRSLQYAEWHPDWDINKQVVIEQIDSKSCSNGRYNCMKYDEATQTVFISYWDKCVEGTVNRFAMRLARKDKLPTQESIE